MNTINVEIPIYNLTSLTVTTTFEELPYLSVVVSTVLPGLKARK